MTTDNSADLINVALEELIRHRLELPGCNTLDELAASVRTEVLQVGEPTVVSGQGVGPQ